MVLIDKDVYSAKNVESQQILVSDIGKPKVFAQARVLRRMRPDLVVEPIHDDVTNVPWGRLRGDAIAACLDSRRVRQYVNEVSWRLGIPWIDSGIRADGMLARVNVYAPAVAGSCLECGWSDRDYELVEQTCPCGSDGPEPAPTAAPSSLGALAASIQAIECRRVLDGKLDSGAAGRQILIDASAYKPHATSSRRNAQCRFDHKIWDIRKLDSNPESLTLAGLFDTAARGGVAGVPVLAVDGKAFARGLTCRECGNTSKLLGLADRLRRSRLRCRCGGRMIAAGFDLVRRLDSDRLTLRELGTPLSRLGFESGDVVTVRFPDEHIHYEL